MGAGFSIIHHQSHCVDTKEPAPLHPQRPTTLPTKHLITSWFRPQEYGLPSKINITTAILSFVERSSWIYCSLLCALAHLANLTVLTPSKKDTDEAGEAYFSLRFFLFPVGYSSFEISGSESYGVFVCPNRKQWISAMIHSFMAY